MCKMIRVLLEDVDNEDKFTSYSIPEENSHEIRELLQKYEGE